MLRKHFVLVALIALAACGPAPKADYSDRRGRENFRGRRASAKLESARDLRAAADDRFPTASVL